MCLGLSKALESVYTIPMFMEFIGIKMYKCIFGSKFEDSFKTHVIQIDY